MWLLAKRSWSHTFSVTPVAKGRPRFSRRGFTYTPEKTRAAETELRTLLALQNPPCFTGAVALNIIFSLKRPKSDKSRKYPIVRPDVDNLGKLVTDAANGILYLDDKQICQLYVIKQYGQHNRVMIHVLEIDNG